MIAYANRASVILFNLLRSRQDRRPFLLPANICPVVPAVFHKARFSFEFVDISEQDFCIDQERVSNLVKSHRYGGVMGVRTYGYYRNLSSFFGELRNIDEDILLVDDRCLCEPSFEDSTEAADVVLYSTGQGKFADVGFGGYAFMKEHVPYSHQPLSFSQTALQSFEDKYNCCIDRRDKFPCTDGDWLDGRYPVFPLTEFKDAVISEISRSKTRKTRLNNYYLSALPTEVLLGEEWNNWRFCIRVKNKARLLKSIFSRGLFASSHYASLAGIFGPGSAPVASRLHESVINLFNDRNISRIQVEEITSLVNKHVKKYGG
jgi:dTDP-4-amino-4,6-dideoxygalactose transaminase